MGLISISTRVDGDLYEQAKQASADLGITLQSCFGECLKGLVEAAGDPERKREAARRGVIAEEILRIRGFELTPDKRQKALENILEILEKVR